MSKRVEGLSLLDSSDGAREIGSDKHMTDVSFSPLKVQIDQIKGRASVSVDPQFMTQIEADTLTVMWEDASIDRAAKRFLKKMQNGKYLPLDIVAHLEFFYNTLLLSDESVNPFRIPSVYQALNFPHFTRMMFPGQDRPFTVLEAHRLLIHPLELSSQGEDLFDSPTSDHNASMISLASLDQNKFHWYPNPQIEHLQT